MMGDSVWHRPPTAEYRLGNSRRGRAVRYTWAGPFNTQLYDDQLKELSDTTRDNLHRLAGNIMQKNQPCDQFGIRHWHTESRPLNGMSAVLPERPQSRGSWSNTSVMFASATTLDTLSRGPQSEADDASIASTASVAMNFCYLCSTMEEHQRNHMRKLAPRSKSLPHQRPPRIDYVAPPPRQKKKVEEPKLNLEALYKVTVWTGDVAGGSTDAVVYLTIVGELDILPKTRLWHRQGTGSKFCFVRGSKEVFYLKGPKLGNLRMITVEHDGLEKRHGWYLDRMEIQCMQSKRVWVFTCKNWLSMHHGDFCTKRDLEPKEKERTSREFEVTVETGKKRLAGTDANVYITVHGVDGSSPKIHLNAKDCKDCFQRGKADKFRIRVHGLGEIRSLRVEHDGSGFASGWFLDKIMLQDTHNPSVMYHFLYNGWLAKDIGDGLLWRELRAKKHLPKEVTSGKPVRYEVIVKTGDVRYAGTDANVYIAFIGSAGKTPKLFMDDARDNFERGMTESFELKGVNVGTLKSVVLGHDNSGPGAGWFCENVKVRKYLSRQEIAEQVMQQKKVWKKKAQKQRRRMAAQLNRQDREASGSEEEVTEKRERLASEDERFADMFDRDGKVVKVPVYEEYFFPCSKWFATDEADGLIERELDAEKQTLFFQER